MRRFKNILVAVDLAQGDDFAPGDLTGPSLDAVERGMWLARQNAAKIRFFHALDTPPSAQQLLNESSDVGSPLELATVALSELAACAIAEGLSADFSVCFGKSWMEVIREVLRHDHDIVVAGTRRLSELQRVFLGSTGMKLLRKCPCPVWITQPQSAIRSILVAHCLRPVGDLAMELACSMAEMQEAQLHVMHSIKFPDLQHALPPRIPLEKVPQFREEARRYIEEQLKNYTFADPPAVHLVTEDPLFAALKLIAVHDVQLVVLGTIARTGVPGFITGNTAELLLPRIPCSVLAIKPTGFDTPVQI